jgi:hypothetical protein
MRLILRANTGRQACQSRGVGSDRTEEASGFRVGPTACTSARGTFQRNGPQRRRKRVSVIGRPLFAAAKAAAAAGRRSAQYSSSFTMGREFGADLCGEVRGYAIGPTNIADPAYPNQVGRLGCVSGTAIGNVHTHHECMGGLPYTFSPRRRTRCHPPSPRRSAETTASRRRTCCRPAVPCRLYPSRSWCVSCRRGQRQWSGRWSACRRAWRRSGLCSCRRA